MQRNGPFTDQTGRTYYQLTNDDGTTDREYVNTTPAPTTTTVGMDGSVVQPTPSTDSNVLMGTSSPQDGVVGESPPTSDLSDLSDLGGDAAQPGQNFYPENQTRSQTFGSNSDNASQFGAPAASYYTPPQPAPGGGNAVVGQSGGRLPGPDLSGSDTGGGYQKQVTVPSTGATAGPFGVEPARATGGQDYGGSSGPDLPGAGGGGRSPLYDKLAAKGHAMAGNVRDMASGVGGGPDPQAQYQAQQQRYRADQRRSTQAQRKWTRMQAKPNYLPTRGILKDLGYSKEMAGSFYDDPQPVLESVLGRDMSGVNRADQADRATPWVDLAEIQYGTGRKKALTSKTPTDKLPHILAQQGWDQPKPATKRITDPSKVANAVRDIYQQYQLTGSKPSGQALLGNLASMRRNSALGSQLRATAKYDPGAAIDSVRSLISSAVMGTRPTDMYQDVLQTDLDTRLGSSMDELAGHRANKITRGVRNVANGLLTRGGLV